MLFKSDFIEFANESPIRASLEAIDIVSEQAKKAHPEDEEFILWEGAVFLHTLLSSHNVPIEPLPKAESDTWENNKKLNNYLNSISVACSNHNRSNTLDELKSRYESALGSTFAYEFTDGDVKRIQEILNELREQITGYEGFEEQHRARLLKRLEKLQSELHKRVADLDKFWGLVGDAGVAIGKFGTDAKPFVDRIREIASITWKTQARSEELPSNISNPMIEENSAD